ncbi:hypothetical protein AMTRI_Chr03g56040 [Amborella trichopoda]
MIFFFVVLVVVSVLATEALAIVSGALIVVSETLEVVSYAIGVVSVVDLTAVSGDLETVSEASRDDLTAASGDLMVVSEYALLVVSEAFAAVPSLSSMAGSETSMTILEALSISVSEEFLVVSEALEAVLMAVLGVVFLAEVLGVDFAEAIDA